MRKRCVNCHVKTSFTLPTGENNVHCCLACQAMIRESKMTLVHQVPLSRASEENGGAEVSQLNLLIQSNIGSVNLNENTEGKDCLF